MSLARGEIVAGGQAEAEIEGVTEPIIFTPDED
jgi:hypothetical protein